MTNNEWLDRFITGEYIIFLQIRLCSKDKKKSARYPDNQINNLINWNFPSLNTTVFIDCKSGICMATITHFYDLYLPLITASPYSSAYIITVYVCCLLCLLLTMFPEYSLLWCFLFMHNFLGGFLGQEIISNKPKII